MVKLTSLGRRTPVRGSITSFHNQKSDEQLQEEKLKKEQYARELGSFKFVITKH
jgi:hypothetical protein